MTKISTLFFCVLALGIMLIPNYIRAQSCTNFSLEIEYVTHSDCQSNGVVKVKLSGADTVNLSSPQFSISSGSHAVPFSANDGLFVGLPPGTYTATVQAYCNNAFVVTKNSTPITITTSYKVPNVDVLERNPSLECKPTGSFKIHIADGKPPYKVVITSHPSEYTGALEFNNLAAGNYIIDNLADGAYSFYVEDICGYRIWKNDNIGETRHQYTVQKTRDTHTCLAEGQVKITMTNGAPPYKITLTEYPAEYTGQLVFSNLTASPHFVDDLPQGNYKFKVQDDCSAVPDSFNIHINKMPLHFSGQPSVTPSSSCDPTGSISFTLPDGVPKYKAEITGPSHIGGTTVTQNSPTFSFTGLAAGTYNIIVTDSCHVDTVRIAVNIVTGSLSVSDIITKKTTECVLGNGEVKFNINDGKKPYQIDINSNTGGSYTHTETGYNSGNYTHGSLPADTFNLKVTDACGLTVDTSFIIKGNTLEHVKIDTLPSLDCWGTGMFMMEITEGKAPYKIEMIDGPPEYSATYPKLLDPSFMGGTLTYVLGNLPDGTYKIKVTDACGSSVEAEFTIRAMPGSQYGGDVPNDPFGEYLHPPETNDGNCQIVRVPVNTISFFPDWSQHSEANYEVAFYLASDPAHKPTTNFTLLQWKPVLRDGSGNFMLDTLDVTYKTFRDNKDSLVAVVRLKNGGNCPTEEIVHDTIKIHPIESLYSANWPGCEGFRLGVAQHTDYRGLICYPYSVVLRDKDENPVAGATLSGLNSANNYNYDWFPNPIPFGKYYIDFTDREGTTWRDSVEWATWQSPMSISHAGNKNLTCTSYTAMFNTNVQCKPYQWKLFKQNGDLVDSSPTPINDDNIEFDLLKYDTVYRILLIGKTLDSLWSNEFSQSRNILANYAIDKGASICRLGTGYIKINRTGSGTDLQFQPGTQIIYLSGTTVPINDTIDITVAGKTEVFPFSADPYTLNYDTIVPGQYQFKVIDHCGVEQLLSIEFHVYSYDTLIYTASPDCENGTTVRPQTTLSYINSGDASGYIRYTIVSGPTGVGTQVGHGGSFLLKVSGDYVIEMSTLDGSQLCPHDSLTITFKIQKVKLDIDATKAYICGTTGYIEIKAIEGSGDYTYQLYDNRLPVPLVETNTTGIFNYGSLGETYTVYITDNQCGRSFPQDITMIDLRDKIISASTDVCIGHTISLSSLPVSDTYLWTGPNGFVSHAKDTIFGPATFADSGVYTITVHPKGCYVLHQDVSINVYQPEEPKINDSIVVCINTPETPLTAVPLPGHFLQWFDADTLALPAAPTPPRHAPDTSVYYVKQSNNINCESTLRRIVFIVEQLPDTVAVAYSNDICRYQKPLIVIPDTYYGYVYRIYNQSGAVVGTETAYSDTLIITSSVALTASETFFVEVETRHQCVAPQRSHVPIRVWIPSTPIVSPVQHCHNAANVLPLKVDSTAGNRLQWYDTDRTTPILSAPVPPTGTVGSISYWVAQIDTLRGCPSDTAEVQVDITPLPDTLINAYAPPICRRTSPQIIINNTYNQYRYTGFDNGGDTIFDVRADGSPLSINNPAWILHQNDVAYIEITDVYNCISPYRAVVPVEVVIPPVPVPFDTLYCRFDAAQPLKATPSNGYHIQWYELDSIPSANAPVPPTATPDTLIYIITQKHDVLGCESDTVNAKILVMPLPDTVAAAYSNDICRYQKPLIVIPDTDYGYVYRIYNQSGTVVGTETAYSDTLVIESSIALTVSETFYIEVESPYQCISLQRSRVPVSVRPPPMPIVTPVQHCHNAVNVPPLKVDSTAGNRLQWYDTDRTTPLSSAPVPPTGTVGSISYWVAQIDTLLGCPSDTAEVRVDITPLPDTLINAYAPPICRRTSPQIIINNTQNQYRYTGFDSGGDTLFDVRADGSPLSINTAWILHQNDVAYIEITDVYNCVSPLRAVVPVEVVIPPLPTPFDTLYCHFASAQPLKATPSNGYHIQWYELDSIPSAIAPVPPTTTPDTLIYIITQKHDVLGCESDTVNAKIIIIPDPDTVAATAPDICPGQYPVIVIPATDSGYIYNVYDANGAPAGSAQSDDGGELRITLSQPIEESAAYFVETVNLYGCPSLLRTTAFVTVFNYMYLNPETIPPFQRERPYLVQLESNAVPPFLYYTEDILPMGFTLSPEGLISGSAPRNGKIDASIFTVHITDVNGCFAARTYMLESDIFIPQVFTPNGDGKNDVFMHGRRLAIFDRLGLKIFEGDNGWDGSRMDGSPAPPDTYFFLIYYEDDNLKTTSKKGYITLVRRR